MRLFLGEHRRRGVIRLAWLSCLITTRRTVTCALLPPREGLYLSLRLRVRLMLTLLLTLWLGIAIHARRVLVPAARRRGVRGRHDHHLGRLRGAAD